MVLRLLFLAFLMNYGMMAIAQYGKKSPALLNSFSDIPVITLQLPDKEPSQRIDRDAENLFKNKVFAQVINTRVDPDEYGIWKNKAGYKVWSVGVRSPGAHSLNFRFSEVQMHAGAQLYIFNNRTDQYLGPYTRHDISVHGFILTPPLEGDLVYLEYRVPQEQPPGYFAMSRVGHGMPGVLKDSRYQLSGYCNDDVNCFADKGIQHIKRSVCRILISNNEYCTGVLVNNTKADGRAYVITANHCIDTPNKARNSLFYFNYESPFCNGPDASFRTIVGAELIATTDKLDFALVELAQEPDFLYQPYFAGWNNQTITPENVYTVHHPQGDVKKVAVDNDRLFLANFGAGYDNEAHWWIETWENGTTEQGSSGAPLINANEEVVGFLSGGSASCDFPNSDYFQRFDLAWDKYGNPDNQLKAWLDPDNSGKLSMEGYDPYASLAKTADTLSNFSGDETLLLYRDDDWGYISGHSSQENLEFAERFSINRTRAFFGVHMHVAHAFTANDSSYIWLKVWKGDEHPQQLLSEQNYPLDYFTPGEMNFFQWEEPVSLDSGNFFVGYEIHYQSQPLDTFAVLHTPSGSVAGNNTAYAAGVFGWEPLHYYYPGNNVSLGIQAVVFDSLPVKVVSPFQEGQSNFRLRPVPAKSKVTIDLEEFHSQSILGKVYNSQGKLMQEFRIAPNKKSIELTTAMFPEGIYIVNLNIEGEYYNQTFIVVK